MLVPVLLMLAGHLYAMPVDVIPNLEYGELVEGDIMLSPGEVWPPQTNEYNAILEPEKWWPEAILYYTIKDELYTDEQILDIEAGIEDLMESTKVDGRTCLDIRKWTGDEPNYVMIEKTGGCSSHVGMKGGEQSMSLEDSCVSRHGTIMHEFMHAYAFRHEHCRGDRDDWVLINWDNIEEGKESNFVRYVEGEEVTHLKTHYDYESVLHYSSSSFAVDDDIPTIVTKDPAMQDVIGQRTHLTNCDIVRLQMLYRCIDEPWDCEEGKVDPPV